MPLNHPIKAILENSGRAWTPNPPAEEGDIDRLRKSITFDLPPEYIELLRYCNGGYGDLAAPPLLFCMDSIEDALEHNSMWRKEGQFHGFWFIGGNGGLETIGFDLRSGPPWPLVMIDCIAGEDSAERIANDMADLIEKIGVAAKEAGA